ncbi:MAG: M20/M25/M40 family metallo-hydrolase [bacterium]|nr:M20/M25/M40 family metallo-hydrolase [bacterium]
MRIVLLVIWCFAGISGVEGSADPDILSLVQKIASENIDHDVRRLVSFETRFMGSDSNAAASVWLGNRLTALGYSVRYDTFSVTVPGRTFFGHFFSFSGLKQWNVIATRRGSLFPKKKVVIGAHYDSIAIDRAQRDQALAPGADDNASGVSALLEIARVMQAVDVDVTVEFALWGAEELGLIGSDHYARQARANGEEILVMVQLDAIGTRSKTTPNSFTIDTTSPYLTQGSQLAQTAVDYTSVQASNGVGGQVFISPLGCRCSDHQSFIDAGYPGLGIFQYIDSEAGHLNMSTDTLDHVDVEFVTQIARATLGSLLQFSGFPGRSADFDGDGRVGFADFLLFARAFQAQEAAGRFDLDRDGRVGFGDFLVFASAFG